MFLFVCFLKVEKQTYAQPFHTVRKESRNFELINTDGKTKISKMSDLGSNNGTVILSESLFSFVEK